MAVLYKLFHQYFQRLREVASKDVFCLLDYLLALGGTYHRPKGVWPTILWYLLQLLTVSQYCMQVLITFDNVARLEDRTSTIWSVMCLLTMTLCYVKQFLIWKYRGTIRSIRDFIVESDFGCRDLACDTTVRNTFSKTVQKSIVAIFVMIFTEQILMAAPSSLRTRWFGIPSWIYCHDYGLALAIELTFYPFFALIWVSKLYCGSATVAILLIGMRTELQILMQYYGCLTKSLQMELSLGPFLFDDRYHKSPRVRALFWNQLRLRTRVAVQQHVQLLDFMATLQPIYEKLFFIIYYQSLVVAGAVSYVIIRERFDLCSVAIILCTSISILECYWWCHLVDTFKDLNETIAGNLLGQCCQLPYSADHRSEYLQMRSTFMIVANVSCHSVAFSCWGVFQISTAVFAKLLNIGYSVLMFLINVYDGGNLLYQSD